MVAQAREATRRCSRCGGSKPLWAFHRRASAPHGYQYHCKACNAARGLERKRQRWRQAVQAPEQAAARRACDMERRRAVRLARRLARAELMLALCAQEYGLERSQILGPRAPGGCYEAQAVATRLMRTVSYLHPWALAEMLDCPEDEIPERLCAARRWTHSHLGDVRVVDRIARLRAAYRRQQGSLSITVKPYKDYTEAQRLPGTRYANQWTKRQPEGDKTPRLKPGVSGEFLEERRKDRGH